MYQPKIRRNELEVAPWLAVESGSFTLHLDSSEDFNTDDDQEKAEGSAIHKPNSSLLMVDDQKATKNRKKHPKLNGQELNRLMVKDMSNLSDEENARSAVAEKADSKSQTEMGNSPTEAKPAGETVAKRNDMRPKHYTVKSPE